MHIFFKNKLNLYFIYKNKKNKKVARKKNTTKHEYPSQQQMSKITGSDYVFCSIKWAFLQTQLLLPPQAPNKKEQVGGDPVLYLALD